MLFCRSSSTEVRTRDSVGRCQYSWRWHAAPKTGYFSHCTRGLEPECRRTLSGAFLSQAPDPKPIHAILPLFLAEEKHRKCPSPLYRTGVTHHLEAVTFRYVVGPASQIFEQDLAMFREQGSRQADYLGPVEEFRGPPLGALQKAGKSTGEIHLPLPGPLFPLSLFAVGDVRFTLPTGSPENIDPWGNQRSC